MAPIPPLYPCFGFVDAISRKEPKCNTPRGTPEGGVGRSGCGRAGSDFVVTYPRPTPVLLPTYSEAVPIYDTKKAVLQRYPSKRARAVSFSIPGKLMPLKNGSLEPITAVNSNQNHQPSAKAQSGSANAATSPVLGVALSKVQA